MIQVAAGEPAATVPIEPPVPTMERGSDGLFELPSPRAPSAGAVDLFALDQPGPRPVPPVPALVSPAVFDPENAAAGGGRRPGVFGWLFRFLG